MNNTKSQAVFSLIDQGAVSGGNFLTIALGAMFLPIGEQAKLIYLYAFYVALVLLNSAVFFSAANLVRYEVLDDARYSGLLLRWQWIFAFCASIGFLFGLTFFQSTMGLQISWSEVVLAVLFLFTQQLLDFSRRFGYVFDHVRNSMLQSVWVYGFRLCLLIAYKPDNIADFLICILVISGFLLLVILPRLIPDMRSSFPRVKEDILVIHYKLSKWSMFNAPLQWIGLHLPILLVGALYSANAAAVIGTVRAVTTFVNVLMEQLETIVPAWMASRMSRGEHALVAKNTLSVMMVGGLVWVIGLFAIWLSGGWIISALLGEDYRVYKSLLYIIWSANGLYFIAKLVGLHYRMSKRGVIEFLSSLSGVVGLLLSLPLIIRYGAWGGAWSLLIVQASVLLGLSWLKLSGR